MRGLITLSAKPNYAVEYPTLHRWVVAQLLLSIRLSKHLIIILRQSVGSDFYLDLCACAERLSSRRRS